MNLRDKLGIFALTKEEQRTIAFVVLMFALGLAVKHYRVTHQPTGPAQQHAKVEMPAAKAHPP